MSSPQPRKKIVIPPVFENMDMTSNKNQAKVNANIQSKIKAHRNDVSTTRQDTQRTQREEIKSEPSFQFPIFSKALSGNLSVQNIWYPNLPEVIPCTFISADCQTRYAQVYFQFLTEDGKSFKITKEVQFSLLHSKDDHELQFVSLPKQQLFASEQAVGEQHYLPISSYLQNISYLATKDKLFNEFGKESLTIYEKDYKLHVTQLYNQFSLGREVTKLSDVISYIGYKETTGSLKPCFNIQESKKIVQKCLKFNQVYLQQEQFLIIITSQVEQIINCFLSQNDFAFLIKENLKQVCDAFKNTEELHLQVKSINPQDLVNTLQYKGQSLDRKAKSSQLLYNLLSSIQPMDTLLIQQHIDEISQLLQTLDDHNNKNECYVLLYWRTLLPLLFFIKSGNIYYRLLLWQVDSLLYDLKSGKNLEDIIDHYDIQKIYLHIMRSFLSRIFVILQDFISYIENDVLCFTQTKVTCNQVTKLSTELDDQIDFQLKHLNFSFDPKYYNNTPYKDATQIQFMFDQELDISLAETSQQYKVCAQPSIEQMTQLLRDKLEKVYTVFFTIPLASSKYYAYIDKTLDNTLNLKLTDYFPSQNSQTQSVMNHFAFNQQQNLKQYDLLLSDDAHYKLATSFYSNFGKCAYISISDAQLVSIEILDDKFEQITSVLTFAQQIIEDSIQNSSPHKLYNDFQLDNNLLLIAQLTQQPVDDKSNILILNKGLDQFKSILDIDLYFHNIDNIVLQVQNIPDFYYQFMMRVDLSVLKRQVISFLGKIKQQIQNQSIQLLKNICIYQEKQIIHLQNKFQQNIYPGIVQYMQSIVYQIDDIDTGLIFNQLFDLQVIYPLQFVQKYHILDLDILLFGTPSINFIKLIRDARIVKQKLQDYQELYSTLLVFVQEWFGKSIIYLSENFKELMRATLQDLHDSRSFPVKFRQNFVLLSQQYNFEPLDAVSGGVDDKFQKLVQKYRTEEKGFYQSFISQQSLPLFTRRYSNTLFQNQENRESEGSDILQSIKPQPKLYQKPNSRQQQGFEIQLILGELYFVSQQLTIFYERIKEWQQFTSLKDTIYPHINISQINSALQPLFIAVSYAYTINQVLDNQDKQLVDINGKDLHDILNDLTHAIHQCKNLAQNTNQINLISDREKVVFEYTYRSWTDYLELVEQTVLQQSGYVNIIFQVQQQCYLDQHYNQIARYFQIDIRSYTLTLKELLENYDKNQLILDYLILLSNNSKIDYEAIQDIENIRDILGLIIFNKFYTKQDIIFPVIYPKVNQSQLLFSQIQIQSILYNIGFIKNQNDLSIGIQKLPQQLVNFKDDLFQTKYSALTEQKARDLEALVQYLQFLTHILEAIPFILQQLILVKLNGNIISFNPKKNSNIKQFNINVLSLTEQNTIDQCEIQWKEIVQQFTDNQQLVLLCGNIQLIKNLQQLYEHISLIYNRVKQHPHKEISKIFKVIQHQITYNTSYDSSSVTDTFIIPYIDKQYYPMSIFIPETIQLYYDKFPFQSYFFKYLQASVFRLCPGITDIVVAHSPTRGRVIIGLKSFDEYLPFVDPILAPQFNFQIADSLQEGMGSSILAILKTQYPLFKDICNKILIHTKENNEDMYNDDIVFDKNQIQILGNFINDNLFQISYICLTTMLRFYMFDSASSIKIDNIDNLKDIMIFENNIILLEIFYQLFADSEKILSSKSSFFVQKFNTIIDEYVTLFQKLEQEVKFRTKLYLKKAYQIEQENQDKNSDIEDQQEENFQDQPQDLSITALLGNTSVNFPLLYYEQFSNILFVSTSNGNCIAQTGNYWLGAPSANNTFEKLQIQQYNIINDMIQGYNQRLPIFILSSQYRFFNAPDLNIIIQQYSQYLLRKFVNIYISESSFARNLKEISAHLISGAIVVIFGSEYLSGTLQMILVTLCESVRVRRGQLPGIQLPYIDQSLSQQQVIELGAPISLKQAGVEDFNDIGSIIFILPHLISTVQSEVFISVPKNQHSQEIEFSKMETSQTFNMENSEQVSQNESFSENQSDSRLTSRKLIKGKYGTNQTQVVSQPSELANLFMKLFSYKQTISIEYANPSIHFEKLSAVHGRSFFEVAGFLGQLGGLAPKFLLHQLAGILEVTDSNKTISIASFLLFYLMRQLPAIVYNNKDNLEFPQLIANQISASFGLQKNETQALVSMAKDAYNFQQSILKDLTIKLPHFDKTITFDDFYQKHLRQQMVQSFQSGIQSISTLYSTSLMTATDFQLIRLALRQKKPFMVVCPQILYAKSFFNTVCGILNIKQHWICEVYQLQELLNKFNFTQDKNQLLIVNILSVQQFQDLIEYIIPFWCPHVFISGQSQYCYKQTDFAKIPQLILLVDQIILKQCMEFSSIQLMTSIFILLPNADQNSLQQTFLQKQVHLDEQQISIYYEHSLFKQFVKNHQEITMTELLKQKYMARMYYNVENLQKMKIQQWKHYSVQTIFEQIIYIIYSIFEPVFGFKNTIDESILHRVMIQSMLYRYGVYDLVKPQKIQSQNIQSQESFVSKIMETEQQSQEELKHFINDNLQGDDISGLFNKVTLDLQAYNRIQLQITSLYDKLDQPIRYLTDVMFNNEIESFERTSIIRSSNTKANLSVYSQLAKKRLSQSFHHQGVGSLGSQQYTFNMQWLKKYYLDAENNAIGIQNLIQVVASSIWSSLYNYYLVVTNNEKWDIFDSKKDSFQQQVSKKYNLFLEQLSNIQQQSVSNKQVYENISNLIGMSIYLDQNPLKINDKYFNNIYSQDSNLFYEKEHIVTKDFSINQTRIQFKLAIDTLPMFEGNYDIFNYIWYDNYINQSHFIKFNLGEGFLSSVTQKTDKQITEDLIVQQAESTFQYQEQFLQEVISFEKQQFQNLASNMTDQMLNKAQSNDQNNVNKPVFQPPIINLQKQISIQRLSKNGVILTIDHHRSAIIQLLSQFMLTPSSAFVYGIRNSGKSTIIDIAKLVIRDIADSQQVFIQDSTSQNEMAIVLKSILQQFNICNVQSFYDIDKQFEYVNILKYKQLSYPSFHVNMSEVSVQGFVKSFPLLLRDHSFNASEYQSITGSNYSYNGLLQFQDMSLIVEVKDQPFIHDTPLIKISMPPFKEQFIEDLAGSFWQKESKQWQKQFAKGICLIKSALPTQLVNSFGLFEKMFLTYQYTLHQNIILINSQSSEINDILSKMKLSLDNELCRGNIHGLFIALRNRSDINQTTMIAVAEKLATLSILKYLGDTSAENPWEDSTLIIKANSQFIPSWEKEIIQTSLDLSKSTESSSHKQLQKNLFQLFKNQPSLQIQSESYQIKNLNLSDEVLYFAFKYSQPNPEFLAQVVLSYKQYGYGIDPIVFSRVFECYLNIQQQKEYIISVINLLQKYSSDSSSIVFSTGFKAQDSYNHIYYQILQLASQSYKKVLLQQNQASNTKFDIQISNDDEINEIIEQQESTSCFSGFSLVDLLGIKTPKCKIIFENVTSKGYSQAVEIFSSLGSYLIVNSDNFNQISKMVHKNNQEQEISDNVSIQSQSITYSESSESKLSVQKQEKILFELSSLFSALDSNLPQKTTKKSHQKLNIIDELKQSIQDHAQVECQDFIALYLICRIAFAYALGINPIYVLPQAGVKSRFNINSQFSQKIPSDIILSGRRQVNRIPSQISVQEDFQREIIQLYGDQNEKDVFTVNHVDNDAQIKQKELLNKYIIEPHQVCIISPKSLLEKLSPENIILLNYITYSTESQCPMEGLFSNEEMANLAVIVSQSYNLPCLIDRTVLSTLLAANLSILVIDDQPFVKEYEYNSVQKIQTIGTCKSPVYEIVKNLHQINNFIMASEFQQDAVQQITIDLNINHDNKIKQQQELKLTQNKFNSEKFIQAQQNMLVFQFKDFLQTYIMSGCSLPNKIDLPQRLQLNWKIIQTQFAISVISVYQWCSLHSQFANISLVQFSQLASSLCNLLLNKCQFYIQQINSLFSSFRLFDVLAGPSNTTKKLLDMKLFDFQNFQQNIQLIAQADQSANASLQLSIAEMAALRDLLFSVIESSKQSFKIITHFAKTAIYDSVSAMAYLIYGMSGNITPSVCKRAISSGEFADLADIQSQDLFAECMCAIMKQQGLQVTVNKESGDSKKVLSILANKEDGMLLNNVIEFISMDIPITFVLKLQNISWVPGDFSYKAIYASSLYWKMGINTFIVDQNLAVSLGLYIQLLMQQKNGNKFSYVNTYDDLVQNKYKENENHIINQHYLECYNFIQIINMQLPVKQLQVSICRALESTLSVIIFTNFGSLEIESESKIVINKLLLMKNRKTTEKRQQINVGSISVVLLQPLHNYPFIFSLVEGASYESAVKDLKIYIQDFYDNTAIIHVRRQSQNNQRKYILQDLVVQSIFGFDFSLRQQTENKYRTAFLRDLCFYQFIDTLREYIHIQFTQIPGNKNLQLKDIDQAVAQQIVNIQSLPQTVLNIAQLISSINNKQNLSILESLLKSSYNTIEQEFIQFQSSLSVQLNDQEVLISLTYQKIVASEGNQIADWIAQAISFVTDIFAEISSYHAPFMAYSNNDFLQDLQQQIQIQIQDYLNKDVLEIAKKKLNIENVSLKQALIFVIQTDSRQVTGKLSKIILPILLQRIFPLLHIEHCVPYYYLASFSFLIILGVLSNQNSENPMQLQQKSIKENISVLFLITQVLQQNQQTHVDLILYSLLASAINNSYPSQDSSFKINHFDQIIPQDMLLSSKMSVTWLWLIGFAKYSPLVNDSINWINLHHSTVAALSESQQPFQSIIKYFINQAGSGNPISALILKELQKNGTLQTLQNKLSQNVSSDQIAQLPFNMDLPTTSILLQLQIMTLGQDQTQVVPNFDLLSTILHPYLGVTPHELLQFVQNTKLQQTSAISSLQQSKDLKIVLFKYLQIPFSLLFEQCGIFYPQPQVKLDTELISESVLTLADIGQRVFRQVAQYQQIFTNSYQQTGEIAPMPVVFVFYDRNIAAIEILEFLHSIHYADQQLKDITSSKILNQIPELEDLSLFSTYIRLDQKSNFSQQAQQLTHLLRKRKSSTLRTHPMYPIFVFIPSNYFAEQMDKCPEDQVNDAKIQKCKETFSQLVDVANPHFCYLQNQNQIDRAYAHYFTLASIVLFNRYSSMSTNILNRDYGQLLNKSQSKPSLQGLSHLFLKYSILMAKPNLSVYDSYFISCLNYIINLNISNAQINQQDAEDLPSLSVDLSIVSYQSVDSNDKILVSFEEQLSHSMRQLSLGNPQAFDQLLSLQFVQTVVQKNSKLFDTSNTENLNQETIDEYSIEQSESKNDEISSTNTLESNHGRIFSGENQEISFIDRYLDALIQNSTNDKIDIDELDTESLRESIQNELYPKQRHIVVQKNLQTTIRKLNNVKTLDDINKVLGLLQLISNSNEDILINNQSKVPYTLSQSYLSQNIRSAFTQSQVQKIISQYSNDQQDKKDTASYDINEMPPSLRIYMQSIKQFQNLTFTMHSHYQNPANLVKNLIPSYVNQNITDKGIYDQISFINRIYCWEISALTYYPILGDILNYLLVTQATQLCVPFYQLRLIITLKPPTSQPIVNSDGSITLSKPGTNLKQPFYIKIFNFELFGAAYDFEADTICDVTPELIQGYRPFVPLYASVAMVQEMDDEYEKSLKQKMTGSLSNVKKVRIPLGNVAIPLKIGGYVRPFVMLRNKTKFSDKEWMGKAPYFGVRFV